MDIAKVDYQEEYDKFMEYHDKVLGAVSQDEVLTVNNHMVSFYCKYNLAYCSSLLAYNKKLDALSSGVDENNKPLSVAKAEIIAEATEEYGAYITYKAHVANLDHIIAHLSNIQFAKKKEMMQM